MITAKIVADSISQTDNRITSFLLTYPRFIHADFMTHRMFSRNASSSRARPIQKVIIEAAFSPALPIFWGKNQKGMQSAQELQGEELRLAQKEWHSARRTIIKKAIKLCKLGMHKQYVNRLLEPFTHITVLCTATDFGNFFNLRAHKDAMPEIQELAFQMLELYTSNIPIRKKRGEWHLPFTDKHIESGIPLENLLKIVTARAARLSYLNFDGDIQPEKDYRLHDELANNRHWSPFEHAALCLDAKIRCANFFGWKPYRKFFTNENRSIFDVVQLIKGRLS
jgi:thymidylate synthase ThyX